jgi:phage shock protein A
MSQDHELRPATMDTAAGECDELHAMLEQPIPVIEKVVADLTAQTAKAIARERALFRDLEKSRSECEQWRERSIEAIKAGDAEVLREALARKDKCQQTAAELRRDCELVGRANRALQRKLRALGARLAERRQSPAEQAGSEG